MQILGDLPASVFVRLRDQGWEWDADEEEYEGVPDPMVLLLRRDGASRFMLTASPSRPDLGVQIAAPNSEPRDALLAELRQDLGLGDEVRRESAWPDL
jgi:hypothetical protein